MTCQQIFWHYSSCCKQLKRSVVVGRSWHFLWFQHSVRWQNCKKWNSNHLCSYWSCNSAMNMMVPFIIAWKLDFPSPRPTASLEMFPWSFWLESWRNLDNPKVHNSIWLPPLINTEGKLCITAFRSHLVCCSRTCFCMLVSYASRYVLYRYQVVLANNANVNNGCFHLVFLTYMWNAVKSNVTSFLTPTFNFWGKWKTHHRTTMHSEGKAGGDQINGCRQTNRIWSLQHKVYRKRA